MTIEVRTPTEEDRPQVADVLRTSLNFPESWARERVPSMPLRDFRGAYDGDRLLATAAAVRFRQWFAGQDLPMAGIYAVATLPEHRAGGLASAAIMQILREARDAGTPLTALFPAVLRPFLRPYRRLGYELAGSFNQHRVALDDIPADIGDASCVELLDVERDLEGLKTTFREWVRNYDGTIEPVDDDWWTLRALRPRGDAIQRAVVVRDGGGAIEGFASFRYEPTPGHLDVNFGLDCTAFVCGTERATRSLLAYFRGYRGVGRWAQWTGPADDPIWMLLPEYTVETPFRYVWMLRLLDVQSALEGRGYPSVEGEAVVTVEDERFPENTGNWRLEVTNGKASVRRADEAARRPLSIGVLSSLYSGYLRVPDAVRLGYLDADDPSAPALERLFSGPDPWCPFFF